MTHDVGRVNKYKCFVKSIVHLECQLNHSFEIVIHAQVLVLLHIPLL